MFTKIFGALSLAFVMAFAVTTANASDFDNWTYQEELDFNLDLTLAEPDLSNQLSQTIGVNGNFLHDYFFTLTDPTDLSFSIDVQADNPNYASISPVFLLQIFDVNDLENPLATQSITANNISVSISNLASGDYVLRFSGTRSGNNGISYGGTASVAVVPLPPAALLLASALMTLLLFGRIRRTATT